MKIGLLSYSTDQAFFMYGTMRKLKEMGHEVILYYNVGKPQEGCAAERVDWVNWEFGSLFSCEKLIVFNGSAKETLAQTRYLKSFFEYKMFFMERGWLPQKHNIYIDVMGCGGRSYLSSMDLKICDGLNDISDKIIQEYIDGGYLEKEPGRFYNDEPYILIPLQLEHDSSIIYDSHTFKMMKQIVHFVKSRNPGGFKIVARMHPLYNIPENERVPGVHYENEIKSLELARKAAMVIGINSTLLIESMLFDVPVFMYGHGVLDASIPCSEKPNLITPPSVQLPKICYKNRKVILSSLYNRQLDHRDPDSNKLKQTLFSYS